MVEFLTGIIGLTIEIAVVIAVGKYLIRYAAKVFAEEFEKIMRK